MSFIFNSQWFNFDFPKKVHTKYALKFTIQNFLFFALGNRQRIRRVYKIKELIFFSITLCAGKETQ